MLAERSMKVLSVPHKAATIINGSLPSGFEEDHVPRFWVLEFIARVSSQARSCNQMVSTAANFLRSKRSEAGLAMCAGYTMVYIHIWGQQLCIVM